MNFPEKDKIFSFLQQTLPTETKVVVAFSGGPDSAFLLRILEDFYTSQGWDEQSIIIAHFNHGQRKESDKELQTICARYSSHHIYYNEVKPKK